MFYYRAFQLSICSELFFPELSSATENTNIDLHITYGVVAEHGISEPVLTTPTLQLKARALWLHVPQVARFLVTDGKRIVIERLNESDEDSIRLFLLGSCMGAILLQRGIFLLHGNAIQVGQHAISFVGRSGIGKSTLTAAFLKRGYAVLADDVCAIDSAGYVLPSYPQIKLWADAAEQLDILTQGLRRVRPCIQKFAVPLQMKEQFHNQPLPLKYIYILSSHNKDELLLEKLTGINKFQSLKQQIYRPRFHLSDKQTLHFMQSGEIAKHIVIKKLTRPDIGYSMERLIDMVEEDLVEQSVYA